MNVFAQMFQYGGGSGVTEEVDLAWGSPLHYESLVVKSERLEKQNDTERAVAMDLPFQKREQTSWIIVLLEHCRNCGDVVSTIGRMS